MSIISKIETKNLISGETIALFLMLMGEIAERSFASKVNV